METSRDLGGNLLKLPDAKVPVPLGWSADTEQGDLRILESLGGAHRRAEATGLSAVAHEFLESRLIKRRTAVEHAAHLELVRIDASDVVSETSKACR
jgi:hypothetical protein